MKKRLIKFALLAALVLGAAGAHGEGATVTQPVWARDFELWALPVMDLYGRVQMQSSFDRTGDNADASGVLYTIGKEKVILDAVGPGVVQRIWMTGIKAGDELRIYLDGAETPAVDTGALAFFRDQQPPFSAPLVVDNLVSSGGFISYRPIPYQKAIRITITGDHYYAIGYKSFAPDATPGTFNGTEDLTNIQTQWASSGKADPKPAVSEPHLLSGSGVLEPGTDQVLFQQAGQGMLAAIRLSLSDLTAPDFVYETHTGRTHRDESSFTLAIPPEYDRITLYRRLYYAVWNQRADVYVEGEKIGQWESMSFDPTFRWRDVSLEIPPSLTKGKSSLFVRIVDQGSPDGLTEYGYWSIAHISGEETVCDALQVGSPDSEQAHDYTAPTGGAAQTVKAMYPLPPSPVEQLLNDVWISIAYGQDAEPAVHAPIGMFFGIGPYGLQKRPETLLVGMAEDGYLYCYFPMPFDDGIRVSLAHRGSTLPANYAVSFEWADTLPQAPYGLFKTQLSHQQGLADDNTDMALLNVPGSGKLVGVLYCPQSEDLARAYFEGDERIYVDGNLTPVIHGTGMEDFFNGGWGFQYDLFTQPMHGFHTHSKLALLDRTSQLRLFLQDAVAFRDGIMLSIEHGNRNRIATEMTALAYYYHQPQSSISTVDLLDIGDEQSEQAHGYAATEVSWTGRRGYEYEGNQDTELIVDIGCRHHGTSRFTMQTDPQNAGVILRRRLDQKYANQMAEVWIDGEYAGLWYDAGSNPYHCWRDSDFLIPAQMTAGKASISVEVRFRSAPLGDWTEFSYWALSLRGN